MLSKNNVSISLENGGEIADITLSCSSVNTLPEHCTLRFTSLVDVSRVPLCLIAGPPLDVSTTNLASHQWFSHHLLSNTLSNEGGQPWWQKARSESPIGILASLQTSSNEPTLPPPKPSDILFYAAAQSDLVPRPPTPPSSSPATDSLISSEQASPLAFRVHALPLLPEHSLARTGTPPHSPVAEDDSVPAIFLHDKAGEDAEVINLPPVRKRRTVNDTFDDASERRQKARRTGGSSIAAAAAVKTDTAGSYPSFSHRRSASGSNNHAVPAPNRPASRGSSVASSRPTTARAASEVPKRSSLARMASVSGMDVEESTETRNKDLISRVVMAGMRLHGLSQSKRKKSKGSAAASQSFEQEEIDRRNDEEYKLVYHQVYKGAQFAFRQHIGQSTLQPHSDALREVVDRLLILFCTDPLENGRTALADKLTPGGRKAFESASAAEAHTSPFASAPIVQTNMREANEKDGG
ncbi:hypothetical protein KC342_g16619 [Hortaea werneckii]|nr:hypothetical protein KC342_g16619 [Hortaea werneckii]